MCKTCADITSEKSCLICKDTSELRKLDPPEDKPLCNLIAKIQIKCRVCNKEMPRGLNLENYFEHQKKECPLHCSFCYECNNTAIFTRETLLPHLRQCQNVKISCSECSFQGTCDDVQRHEFKCKDVLIKEKNQLEKLIHDYDKTISTQNEKIKELEAKLQSKTSNNVVINDILGEYMLVSNRVPSEQQLLTMNIAILDGKPSFKLTIMTTQSTYTPSFKIENGIIEIWDIFNTSNKYIGTYNSLTNMMTGYIYNANKQKICTWFALRL